jgi:hypothetical protein
MGGGSSTQTDTMVVIWKRRPMTGTILLASTSRWTRPTSASSTAKASLFMRASRLDGAIDPGRARESAELSSDRIRDRANGADPVSRVEPTRPSRVSRAGRPIRRSSRVRHSRRVGGATWSATDETVEIFVEADTNELPENRRRFALIQHPSSSVQPSNRRGHETKERKAFDSRKVCPTVDAP